MKKILLAGILLTACSLSMVQTNATVTPVKEQVRLALPKPVADAFRAFQAEVSADGRFLTNVQWSHSRNRFTVTFTMASENSDELVDGSATWLASGQRVN